MRDKEGYRQFTNELGVPFQTVEEFATGNKPYGLGLSRDVVRELPEERENRLVAPILRRVGRPTEEEQAEKGTVGTFKCGGNPVYLTARIQRDHPDIAERLSAGEFNSVAEAGRAAGVASLDRRVWLPADPERAARALLVKFDRRFIEELIGALQELIAEDCRR